MKCDMSAVINDIEGEPVVLPTGEFETVDGEKVPVKEELTLRKACVRALLAPLPEDQKLNGEKRLELYNLASKCQTVDAPEFKSEQVSKIKDRVMKTFTTLIYGRVDELLEGTSDSGD